jgi:hypothetical protein
MKNNYAILSNFMIIDLIKALGLFDIFGGVYAKDQLIKLYPMKKLFIVNLDDYNNIGTHWCAFSTIDNNVCYYDSYGGPPPIDVDNYIKRSTGKKKYEINTTQIQPLNSQYCGYFSVFFLWVIMNHTVTIKNKIKYFNSLFNNNLDGLKGNYNKLVSYFEKILF